MERINIPAELVEEILSRVSAKSLARFRSTCKGWRALLKSGSFAERQSSKAPKESLIIMLMDFRVYLVRINLDGIHNNLAPTFKYQLYFEDPLFDSLQVDIRRVFHCDGLLLCTTRDNRLVVWNPCLGETKWIKPTNSYDYSDNYALGYENQSSCKKHKILMMYPGCHYYHSGIYDVFELYDFASDSWKELDVPTKWRLRYSSYDQDGMSLKGNTYWLANDYTNDFLLRFDFSLEIFSSIALPHCFPFMVKEISVVREDQLFLLTTDSVNPADSHVWVATSTGSDMSWSKFQTLKANLEGYNSGLSFLPEEQYKFLLVCYNDYSSDNKILHIVGENEHIRLRHPNISCKSSCKVLLNYVPSLAQIQ
ncbi:hypothetical protein EUTSA_v10022163mg [Eutrema salsugineum]|uniref:F-box domain-containing protein n=1 Tax=Eutrema salsugineum TaxID=72664 RepID=V4NM86_EUTSA|nr:hypothetical protein EUTSA_v10022163mg [Eutrema salsugineum]